MELIVNLNSSVVFDHLVCYDICDGDCTMARAILTNCHFRAVTAAGNLWSHIPLKRLLDNGISKDFTTYLKRKEGGPLEQYRSCATISNPQNIGC